MVRAKQQVIIAKFDCIYQEYICIKIFNDDKEVSERKHNISYATIRNFEFTLITKLF
ncbi:hypothetical protein C2G38_368097 [Gigaspora rosea]|uniref:Uncharacterized protein n=1 Tax=Gigaspora rosea TaxID=44941 RepID=A0A397VVJ6_9GLOM|nr:hypothetical protein C2G38_368097 [Gigaspora rosea]